MEASRGMPTLREGIGLFVDLVEAGGVEMVREGCRAAEVWMVSEMRNLDGAGLREAVEPGGALEKAGKGKAGKGKAGKAWGEVARRMTQVRGVRVGTMDRMVRAGAESRCNRPLGVWVSPAVSD